MRFQTPLVPARLIRRYKRFLADVVLESDGREVTAHCPNPGAMLGLADPGMRVWLEPNDDPKKKLKFGWRLVELDDGHWAGIDTGVPNRVVREALEGRLIVGLGDYAKVRPEVSYGANSRVDFLLETPGGQDTYVEVKNVHLRRDSDLAEFPDCVTKRGAKHLDELSDMVARGHRAVMLYLVQRTDCRALSFARDIDPAYGAAFDAAKAAGVEAIVYDTAITTEGVTLRDPLPLLA
ncbi:MAG: DNA/RNA nuclease SfsA [Paracoccaceae bacterium]|nr:DNA/RNA nuclease SfsA [Paracoccaceae bacterium]